MRSFFQRHKHLVFLLLIMVVAEVLVNPMGNFPLNDDWSYAQTLKKFYLSGEIFLGNVPAMTLYTQILWGYVFVKMFGFSLFVLRCSTLVATFIGLVFMHRLVTEISGNKALAFLCCLVLLFNPLVFNLSNSYMTDANFNTLLILCCYFIYRFLHSPSIVSYVLIILFSAALVLLRQFGMVMPACFLAGSFFVTGKKWRTVALALLSLIIVIVALKWYEQMLMKEPYNSAYKFSGGINPVAPSFWEMVLDNLSNRYREILVHMLVYSMPVAVMFMPALLRRFRLWTIFSLLFITLLIVCNLFDGEGYFSPSTFLNAILGNEIFHESWNRHHNEYLWFSSLMAVVKWISSAITLLVLLLGITAFFCTPGRKQAALRPGIVFLALLVPAYWFMILITDSYFDRYHIPLITLQIILLAYLGRAYFFRPVWLLAPLLFWMYISIAGTKDYLEWNRLSWDAYWYLRREKHVPAGRINGGGEINCWNEGMGMGWQDYFTMKNFDYLIQFGEEDKFIVPFREYKFQRYLPYKEDKIYIFVRQKKAR